MRKQSWLELMLKFICCLGFMGLIGHNPDIPGHEQSTPEMLKAYGILGIMIIIPCLVQWWQNWGWFREDPPPSKTTPTRGETYMYWWSSRGH